MKDFNNEIKELAKNFNKPPIFDGIVNEDKYQNSKVKIMWVLKEANSTGEDDSYDLRDAINNLKTEDGIRDGWEKTFSNIIYVTEGILNKTDWDDIPFPKDKPEIVNILKEIAYVNIKKVGGGPQSVKSELQVYFEKSKELLINQINEFNPDVVIFGNTYQFFEKELGLNQMNIFGSCHATAKKNRIYINAYHPNNRIINGKDYFEDIIKAYKTFKKQIDNIDKKTYSNQSYNKDIELLKDKVFDAKRQVNKIETSLISVQNYEKASSVKTMNKNLEQILNDIHKLRLE